MKKMLFMAVLFSMTNSFSGESAFGREAARLQWSLITEASKVVVPSRLCVKALNEDKPLVAEYIGKNFLGDHWQCCREYCQEIDAFMARCSQQELDEYKALSINHDRLVKGCIWIQAFAQQRQDVVDFLGDV